MGKWAATMESAEAMIQMTVELERIQTSMKQEADKLGATFEENEAGLGNHSDSIKKLIEQLGEMEEEAGKPIRTLKLKLLRASKTIITHIQIDKYKQEEKGRSR